MSESSAWEKEFPTLLWQLYYWFVLEGLGIVFGLYLVRLWV